MNRERRRYTGVFEPKPFAFVAIPKEGPEKDEYLPHDKFVELTGELQFELEVTSDYLYVGSGNYDLGERDIAYHSFFRTNGEIAIPGTSIKGGVRSAAEALSNSCVSQGKERIHPEFRGKCSFNLEKKKIDLCPSCKLFGTTGYAGRINFSDAMPEKCDVEIVKIHELFSPRNSKSGYRKFYQNKRHNPIGNLRPEKNYRFVEAVKKGSIFKISLSFHNLLKKEFALLFYAMGVGQDYMIKIGGAKPRCFGTVQFSPSNLKLWKDPLDKAEEKIAAELKDFVRDVLTSNELIIPDLLNQFRNEISKQTERCPKGMY